jgi:hypothetical protein
LREAVRLDVYIPPEDLKDGFNDFVKKELDVDLKGYGFLTRKDEVYTELSTLPVISDKPVKLVGIFKQSAKKTNLYLLGQIADESFLSSTNHSAEFASLSQLAYDFLQFYVPQYYNELVEDANEKYEDADKDLRKKQEDLEKNQRELVKLRQEIVELENEIVEDKREVRSFEEELRQSRRFVTERKDQRDEAIGSLAKIKVN